MAAEDWQFGVENNASCGHIDIERNHDNLATRQRLKQYNDDLNGFLWGTHCEHFFTNNQNRGWSKIPNGHIDDERFVHFIFNPNVGNGFTGSKNAVFDLGDVNPGPAHEISYTGQEWDDDGNLEFSNNFNGKIYSFRNINNNPSALRGIITTIVDHLNKQNNTAYLFVDVGASFLTKLNDVMDDNDDLCFHVINSQCSFADSAKEGKDLWDQNFFYNKIHCWWYNKDIVVPIYDTSDDNGDALTNPQTPYNYSFHSGGSVIMKDFSTDFNEIRVIQLWIDDDDGTVSYNIKNASFQNSKSQVNIDFWNVKSKDSDKRNLCYMRKRSGDGFQIWFMEQFATILYEYGDDDFGHTCGWGTDNPDYVAGYGLLDSLEEYGKDEDDFDDPEEERLIKKLEIRSQSFFVTGDWPAACWAAYCHCNFIFHRGSGGGEALIFIADPKGIQY